MIQIMQNEAFEAQWAKARQLEAAGNAVAAIETYEEILAKEPYRLYARLRVSTLLQMQGSYRRARQHAVDAVESVRHSRWNDLPHVTSKLLTFDEHRLLLELVRGVDWNHQDVIVTSPFLIQHLWLTGAVEDSLRLAEIALRAAPSHAQLNYAHGIVLGYLGRIPEAVSAYEKCIEMVPGYAAAHWSLAYAGKQTKGGLARVARIEAVLQEQTDPEESPFLHYAAFKELDGLGDHGAAWAHLSAGAKIKRARVNYDVAREIELTKYLLGQDAKNRHSETAENKVSAVFVVGMPRTGTTVLDRILGNHPKLFSAGELSDFRSALNYALDMFIGAVPSVESMCKLSQVNLEQAGRGYLAKTRWRAHNDETIVVDKHPENFFLSASIMDAMPGARIICLRRNPMDACFSNLKELFANKSYGYSYDLEELADHYQRFDQLSRHWAATRPNKFLLVDYEELVAEPNSQARRVFDFLGLHYSSEYTDITRNTTAVTTASASQVREPISTKNIGAWSAYEGYLGPLKERLKAGRQVCSSRPG